MTTNPGAVSVLSALALAATLSACASAPTGAMPPAGLSWYVTSVLNDFYNDADDPTNRPIILAKPPEGVIRPVDINKDGITDWIIEWPRSSQFCGTGGCRVTVYLTHGQNLIRIFDRQALEELSISTVDGEARLESRFHHNACRGIREICRLAWGLDPAERKLLPRRASNGDTAATPGGDSPIDSIWAGYP